MDFVMGSPPFQQTSLTDNRVPQKSGNSESLVIDFVVYL
jgi:hypothetical protein